MILTRILDEIMDQKAEFEFLDFKIGKRKNDYSTTRIQIFGESQQHLNNVLTEVFRLGATTFETPEVEYQASIRDMVLPEDFYSTSNHPTSVYMRNEWVEVEQLMMDKQIVVDPEKRIAYCKPISQVKKGDLIVVGERGIRIKPPERPREGVGVFEFMNSDVSSEKPSTSIIRRIAQDLRKTALNGGKIVVVAGPAVIHTGAAPYLARMVELGYVDALLSGNALAVHDVEYALYGTSLGVKLDEGNRKREPRNHIAAINEVNKAGSLRALVMEGGLRTGIFYQLIVNDVPFVLAASIRDDGPIPDVVKNSIDAQALYKEQLQGANYVIMLASTLHSIAVGNMLTSGVKIVCVDINPAVVTKLSDRGTSQAVGLVSDIGTFLPLLVNELEKDQQ
jgi:lysine-ketoglutarate reductase/saccharopine dehydrogenase-like protein (TIGR00300 family)